MLDSPATVINNRDSLCALSIFPSENILQNCSKVIQPGSWHPRRTFKIQNIPSPQVSLMLSFGAHVYLPLWCPHGFLATLLHFCIFILVTWCKWSYTVCVTFGALFFSLSSFPTLSSVLLHASKHQSFYYSIYSLVWMYHGLLKHLLLQGYLGCLQCGLYQ